MPDVLLDGLPVLDFLEITLNTHKVAHLTGRDQSSVSRIHRKMSELLGIDFGKQRDGIYRAGANQALLNGLRQSSQWLRLNQQSSELRWVGHPGNRPLHRGEPPVLPAAVELHSAQHQRIAALLEQRVLDLAVVETEDRTLAGGPLTALPLVRYPLLLIQAPESPGPQAHPRVCVSPLQLQAAQKVHPLEPLPWPSGRTGIDVILVRTELLFSPAIGQLIQAIRASYRRHFEAVPDLDWTELDPLNSPQPPSCSPPPSAACASR